MAYTDGSSPSKFYLMGWGGLAIAAMAYGATVILRPDILPSALQRAPAEQESNKGTRSLSKALAEMKSLRHENSRLQQELTSLRRGGAAEKPAASPAATQQTSPAVDPPATVTPALQAPPAAAPAASPPPAQQAAAANAASPQAVALASKFAAGEASEPGPAAAKQIAATEAPATLPAATPLPPVKIVNARSITNDVADVPLPTRNERKTAARMIVPKVDAFGGEAQIETGSVKPSDPITFGAPVITRTRPAPAAVQIASGPSVDALRLNWLMLTDQNRGWLGNLKPRYVAVGRAGNLEYKLVAGPLKSEGDADALCRQLAQKNVSCSPTTYGGKKL